MKNPGKRSAIKEVRDYAFITVGMFLFAIDCVVVLAAAVFISTEQALYAFISIYVCSKVIDAVMMGFGGNRPASS